MTSLAESSSSEYFMKGQQNDAAIQHNRHRESKAVLKQLEKDSRVGLFFRFVFQAFDFMGGLIRQSFFQFTGRWSISLSISLSLSLSLLSQPSFRREFQTNTKPTPVARYRPAQPVTAALLNMRRVATDKTGTHTHTHTHTHIHTHTHSRRNKKKESRNRPS